MQDTVRGELDMVLHPEHGTRSADELDEPGDHTAVDGDGVPDDADLADEPTARRVVTNDIGPIELAPTEHAEPDSGSTDPSAAPTPRRRRFLGPPDSFI